MRTQAALIFLALILAVSTPRAFTEEGTFKAGPLSRPETPAVSARPSTEDVRAVEPAAAPVKERVYQAVHTRSKARDSWDDGEVPALETPEKELKPETVKAPV